VVALRKEVESLASVGGPALPAATELSEDDKAADPDAAYMHELRPLQVSAGMSVLV
jgi:hypothetical protein